MKIKGYLTSEMGDPTFRVAEIPCATSNQAIGSCSSLDEYQSICCRRIIRLVTVARFS